VPKIFLISFFIVTLIVQPVYSFAGKVLTLNEAIDIALKKNPLLKSKENEVAASKEEKRAAWGNLLPQINSYGSYSRLSDPIAVTPAKSPSKPPDTFSRSLYRYGVNLKIPVYEGGRLWTRVSIARFSNAISKANLRFTKQDIIANLTNIVFCSSNPL
jgi:outer membrane protein TolC